MVLNQEIIDKIHRLPKVELHRHMEGCISAELLLEIARDYNVKLPTDNLEELRSLIQIKGRVGSLQEFLDKFYWVGMAFPTLEAVERVSYCVCRDCARDNIRVLELRFSPVFMSLETPHGWEELLHAVLKGARRAENEFDINVGFIVGISRSNGLKLAMKAVNIAGSYVGLGVVGVDLFGDEAAFPPELFIPAFKVAQAQGLNVTIHAGEGGGETNVRTAIEELGARRIGHGIRIINDEKLMAWIRDRGIPLEIALTSNVQTQTVPDLASHPVRRLYDYGIKISLNTDDPAICDTTFSKELLLAMEVFDFTLDEIKGLMLSAFDQSFLEEYRKKMLRPKLEMELAGVK
ncbi:MAG: adenosine deaminase [Candidatus Euphemobacter frigidus]|nr:adenosine deaminase [Candidatus Euphemobacter frigidus]MDP8275621.1 adenosine deaminase [Candidatus Euphemobacter frigidus]